MENNDLIRKTDNIGHVKNVLEAHMIPLPFG